MSLHNIRSISRILAITIITSMALNIILPTVLLIKDVYASEVPVEPVSYPVEEVIEEPIFEVPEEEIVVEDEEIIQEFSETIVVGTKETFSKIELNKEYTYSLNKEVKIIFTKLPSFEGNSFSIDQVNVEHDGQSLIGFDFSTDMPNESFEYTLTLPNEYGDEAQVQYSEDGKTFENITDYSTEESSVEFSADHFTIFIIIRSFLPELDINISGLELFEKGMVCGIGSALMYDKLEVTVENWSKDLFILEGRMYSNGAWGSWVDYSDQVVSGGGQHKLTLENDSNLPDGLVKWEFNIDGRYTGHDWDKEQVNFTVVSDVTELACGGTIVMTCNNNTTWANSIELFDQQNRKNGSSVLASRSNPIEALGENDSPESDPNNGNFVSLGFGGSIILEFTTPVMDFTGDDLWVYEMTSGRVSYPEETAMVEVSSDGLTFVELGTATSKPTGVSSFDLATQGVNSIRYVRITDISDKSLFEADADGFDLDAVQANCGRIIEDEGLDIELCKQIDGELVSGWDLGVARRVLWYDVEVDSINGTTTPLLPSGDYLLLSEGTYRYGDSTMIADAGHSFRPVEVMDGTGSWVSGDNLSSPYEGYLKLQYNQTNVDWGVFRDEHMYMHVVHGFAGGAMNFRILDDDYSDNLNNNFFEIGIYKIEDMGTTGENGCTPIEFNNYNSNYEYTAFEVLQDGWDFSDFIIGDYRDNPVYQPMTIYPVDEERYIFINGESGGMIDGYKYWDVNGNGNWDEGEEGLEGWNIKLYDEEDNLIASQHTTSEGYFSFNELAEGYYEVCEEMVDGWFQTQPNEYDDSTGSSPEEDGSYCYYVTLENTGIETLEFGNAEGATIIVSKNLLDAEENPISNEDEFEVELITELSVPNQFISDNGENSKVATFNIISGLYSVDEIPSEGYLDWGCSIVNQEEEVSRGISLTIETAEAENDWFWVSLGETVEVECTNVEEVVASLTIQKTNNTNDGIEEKTIGDEVEYQIQLKANDYNSVPEEPIFGLLALDCVESCEEEPSKPLLNDIVIADLLPNTIDFDLTTGEYNVQKITAENEVINLVEGTDYSVNGYTSPGIWNFNIPLEPNESFLITYKAFVAATAGFGLHRDAALARANGNNFAIAVGNNASTIFTSSTVGVGAPASADVLGASTTSELPDTGSDLSFLMIGITGVLTGLGLVFIGVNNSKKRSQKFNTAGKSSKVLSIIFGLLVIPLLFGFVFSSNVHAADSDLHVRLSGPAGTGSSNVDLNFVTLDAQGRQLVASSVECYVKRTGEAVFDVAPFDTVNFAGESDNKAFGNEGICQTNSSVFSNGQGTYQFKAVFKKSSDTTESSVLNIQFDNNPPSSLSSYSKSRNNCTFTLNYTTANDGQTDRVQIFRSQSNSFTANSVTLVANQDVNPNSPETFVDNIAGCNSSEYYYALRAVDASGNTSAFVTDNLVVVVPAQTVQGANANLVGADGEILGELEDRDGVIADLLDNEDSDVLGEGDELQSTIDDAQADEEENASASGGIDPLVLILGLLALFGIIAAGIYVYQKRDNDKIS